MRAEATVVLAMLAFLPLCRPASAHDPVLVNIAARLKQACPQAIIRYDTRDVIPMRLSGVIYPKPGQDEYLIASYRLGVFAVYKNDHPSSIQQRPTHKEIGPDNQGFCAIIYTHREVLPPPAKTSPQNAFPKSFPHPRDYNDGGGWIEYINRYRLHTGNTDVWLDLSYGRKSDWRTLKKIKQAVFADAKPIDHHDFPFYF